LSTPINVLGIESNFGFKGTGKGRSLRFGEYVK